MKSQHFSMLIVIDFQTEISQTKISNCTARSIITSGLGSKVEFKQFQFLNNHATIPISFSFESLKSKKERAIYAVRSYFKNNRADEYAILRINSGFLTSDASIYENNEGKQGGAIYIEGSFDSLEDTFQNNVASEVGGAIFVKGSFSDSGSSFIENRVQDDGQVSTCGNGICKGSGGAVYLIPQFYTFTFIVFIN